MHIACPTLAGPGNFGGWFEEKVFGKAGAAVVEAPKAAPPASAKTYSLEEVAKHNKKEDVWIVVKGKVRVPPECLRVPLECLLSASDGH